MEQLGGTWAQIDLDAIRHNFKTLCDGLSLSCRTMAVVKADAYGHGDGYTARTLLDAGADWLAVSSAKEAFSLRAQDILAPILILGNTPSTAVGWMAQTNITQTVFSFAYAQTLSHAAVEIGVTLNCHIKVDTGMSRLGVYAQGGNEARAAQEISAICALPGLNCTGIFTHFACADEPNPDSDQFTRTQYDSFCKTCKLAALEGARFPLRHCCNSAATIRFPEMHLDMVRLGIALYGLSPSSAMCEQCEKLKPAMSLYSVATLVKDVEKGVAVSYGRRFITPSTRRLATVSVGYADGYRRNFGGKARVILNGRYAPVVGVVCMDQMMIDVTDIPDVQEGDRVMLIGEQGGAAVTLDDFAQLNGSINYEEACLIGRRVSRVYIENGREIAVVDYIIQTREKAYQ